MNTSPPATALPDIFLPPEDTLRGCGSFASPAVGSQIRGAVGHEVPIGLRHRHGRRHPPPTWALCTALLIDLLIGFRAQGVTGLASRECRPKPTAKAWSIAPIPVAVPAGPEGYREERRCCPRAQTLAPRLRSARDRCSTPRVGPRGGFGAGRDARPGNGRLAACGRTARRSLTTRNPAHRRVLGSSLRWLPSVAPPPAQPCSRSAPYQPRR